jgi:hypothetical protein
MSFTDVIVSAFATPPQQSYRALAQDTTLFVHEPLVLGVEPQMEAGEVLASAGFDRTANALQAQDPQGSILRPLLRRLKGYSIRSVTLIGFSAGNQFVKRVLATPDAEWVDGVICLDGLTVQKLWNGKLHEPDLKIWGDFAVRAAKDRRLFVNAHTDIASHSKQVTSTAEAAEAVMDYVQERVTGTVWNPPFDANNLVAGPPPPSVTITVNRPTAQGNVPITRTWDEMPMPAITAIGNAWSLSYGGNAEPDHVFISRYVQRAIWKTFLAPRFNAGLFCAGTTLPVSGLGQDEEPAVACELNRKLVPSGQYPTDPMWPELAAAGAGLAFGIGVGYWFGRKV